MKTLRLTAQTYREGNLYVSSCPELDICSQGSTVEKAIENLKEAVDLWLECSSDEEKVRRIPPYANSDDSEVFSSRLEVDCGKFAGAFRA